MREMPRVHVKESHVMCEACEKLSFTALFYVAVLLNAPWEILQTPLYAVEAPFSLRHLLICCAMSIADAVIIVGISFTVQVRLRRVPTHITGAHYVAIAVMGASASALGERFALAVGWWSYTKRMPTLLGVGVSPLLQLALLSPAALFLALQVHRSATASPSR